MKKWLNNRYILVMFYLIEKNILTKSGAHFDFKQLEVQLKKLAPRTSPRSLLSIKKALHQSEKRESINTPMPMKTLLLYKDMS